MLLTIKFLSGKTTIIRDLAKDATVGDLKARVVDIDGAPNPAMLLFGSRLMADDTKRLSDLEVFDDTCVMCVPGRCPAKGAAPKGAAPKGAAPKGAAPKDAAPKDAAPMEEQVPAPAPAPAPAKAPAAGEAKAAAQPKGEGGGGAKHDAGAKEDDVDTMLPLQIKTLSGVSSSIEVPVHANFGHIKHKYIQPVTDIPAVQMRLIYLGQLVDDTKSPFEYNIFSGSFVHLVRRPDDSIKKEVITKAKLRANCPYCHKAGVQLALRPICGGCKTESAMYKDRQIVVGESKWSELEGLKGICYRCGNNGKEVPLFMGFLCTGQPGDVDGPSCPGRRPGERKMRHVYEGKNLVDSLNQIFGYAHARGFEV
eukprot:CAMPEP_0195539254 /NCGR_PEP_ID=MMETSP0794_2-20130614/49960_1 /TAXON_ID=515487 /ORGANISM="Stephanopyxis turris, Strain CCMP 815" /LENGTH=365 /DNA_ID=CAMNT_0040673279 /DNA_START=87 /DNA_END=1184 /DNA_ORIENTATION=-